MALRMTVSKQMRGGSSQTAGVCICILATEGMCFEMVSLRTTICCSELLVLTIYYKAKPELSGELESSSFF